jgi:hypothetical protein
LTTIQKNETPNKKKKKIKEKKKKKKHVDIPDIPKFLLDIPYGIMTSCVSVGMGGFFASGLFGTSIPSGFGRLRVGLISSLTAIPSKV